MAEDSGPQKYAPPDRRAPEQGSGDADTSPSCVSNGARLTQLMTRLRSSMQWSIGSLVLHWRKLTGLFVCWKACVI